MRSWQIEAPVFPEIITIEFVKQYVQYIAKVAETGDCEIAHSREDSLFFIILEAIAQNKCENPMECCVEAIKTSQIEFARYCS